MVMWGLRSMLLIAAIDIVVGSSQSESCVAGLEDISAGSSLLQAKSKETPSLSVLSTRTQATIHQAPGAARAVLPPHLFEFGMQLLSTEQMLDAVVANSIEHSQIYAGISMKIRMVMGDAVDSEDAYGLATLGQLSNGGMMSMIDIGGNYGRVTIAAFKLHPANLRIVTVEPVPSTYFLLRWNLWLNGVPEIELQEFYHNPSKPGVLPLNHGISDSKTEEKMTGFCYAPPRTMQARVCDCAKAYPGEHCSGVISKSLNTLVSLFVGATEITLLKMDCEGCEIDVIPSLMALQADRGLRVHRFAGELHVMRNELEDFACQAEGAKWFVSICYLQGVVHTIPTKDRCAMGPSRESCEN